MKFARAVLERLPGSWGLREGMAWSVGKTATLPPAAAPRRGEMRRVEGAAGVADRLLWERKNAGDAYEWADIPTLVGAAKSVIPVFNVADYNAKGDGATENDPDATIKKAIDAAKTAGGGIVFIPAGTYLLGAPAAGTACLLLDDTYSNITIMGAGRGATILKVANNADAQVIALNGTTGCKIADLTIDGNNANQIASGFHGISISGTGNILENLHIMNNNGYGIGCAQGATGPTASINGCVFRDLHIEHTGADGIDFKNNLGTNEPNFLENILVEDFDFNAGGAKAGIDIRGIVHARGIDIRISTTLNTACYRWRIGADGSTLNGFTFSGDALGIDGTGGLAILGVGCHASNGTVRDIKPGAGIADSGATADNVITAVNITNCGDGIRHGAGTGSLKVIGGSVRDCDNAVRVQSDADDGSFFDLDLYDSVRGYFIEDGDRTRIRGGRLVGTFTQALRIDANSDATIIEGLDATLVSAGSITHSGTNTTVRHSPGLADVPAITQSLTIATGVVTMVADPTRVITLVLDTEAAAATDDLVTINGGVVGQLIILNTANNARDVVCKDATGNLSLSGDFTIGTTVQNMMLFYDGANWQELAENAN